MSELSKVNAEFDWAFPDDETAGDDIHYSPSPLRKMLRFWVAVIVALGMVGGVLGLFHWDTARHNAQIREDIQAMLDLAAAACRSGDGNLFFSLQDGDPAWQSALLRPQLVAAYCSGLQLVDFERWGAGYRAVVGWGDGGQQWQRLAFFSPANGGVVQTPAEMAGWGKQETMRQDWGVLHYHEMDEPVAAAIARMVGKLVGDLCHSGSCGPDRQPFTLEMRSDYRQAAAPNVVYIPSPRLLAVDESGYPAPAFWSELSDRVRTQLTPGHIRFAVPSYWQQVIHFEEAAQLFNQQNRDITVEIVPLDLYPEEVHAGLADYDGAAFTPSAAMIAAGLVVDLTDFASDGTFDNIDFYEQMWQGSMWRGRLWSIPLAGQMRLIYYDKEAYALAGLPEPSLRWTWDEMVRDMTALSTVVPTPGSIGWNGSWAYLDPTRDTLFAYAYNHQTACRGIIPARCGLTLSAGEMSAALGWYGGVEEAVLMPPMCGATPADRAWLMANRQSANRYAAIWVDDLVSYEHHLQMWPVGVVPFPGSALFDGNTPLWVHGGFISATSERPGDVWRWLDFLTYQPLNKPLRYVPARPSLAVQSRYWDILPVPIREAMRVAFPMVRPVGLEDRRHMTTEQLAALHDDCLSATDIAYSPSDFRWFGR